MAVHVLSNKRDRSSTI